MKISPTLKGLITAALMIGVILGIYYSGKDADPKLQYLVYALYALGIAWTLLVFRQSASFTGKFGTSFGQGFKCFIVVTLLMALFYGIFNYMHPEFVEESSKNFREQMEQLVVKKEKLPTEVETEVATFKKQYILKLVSGAIFGYLIIGAGVTAVVSALLTRRK